MDLVEEIMLVVYLVWDEVVVLWDEWQCLCWCEMQLVEFCELYGWIDWFFVSLNIDVDMMYNSLFEILLVQDFQDLIGQVIQKVIVLVKEVEEQMLSFVVMVSYVDQFIGIVYQFEDVEVLVEQGVGFQINVSECEDVVLGQDDVDDLLFSFGF